MDFLFDRPAAVNCSPSVHDAADNETILLSKRFWDELGLSLPSTTRVAFSISLVAHCPEKPSLNSLVCWGILSEDVSGLSVPRKWLEQYPALCLSNDAAMSAGALTHRVTVVHPAILTEVVLEALSNESYVFASARKSFLEQWLLDEQVILRQGTVYSFEDIDSDSAKRESTTRNVYHFRLIMATPVLQGCAKRQTTQLYITSAPCHEDIFADTDSEVLSRQVAQDEVGSTESESESGENCFEIDEAFLAGTVLHSAPQSSPRIDHNGSIPLDKHEAFDHGESAEKLRMHISDWNGVVQPLTVPTSPEWDDCTVYVGTADLSRIGVLNGDWAIVRVNHGSSSRLVRVCVWNENTDTHGTAFVSPQLLHNIIGGNTSLEASVVCIQSSPFGSHRPTIPTARSMTIARVASPASTDRTYQPLFLRGLQEYFKRVTRLVKQGDIIVVKINTDEIRSQGDLESGIEDSAGEDVDSFVENTSSESRNANEMVFFIVTNIEHNVLTSRGEISTLDAYVGSTAGELGCWVDPAVTRMVQTGVEHARVPDSSRYLGLNQSSTFLDSEERTSSLFAPDSAYSRLLALSSAALNRHALDYQLQLAILLKGPKGVGKRTAAAWVSQRLGIHLYEVNCYDIIGDNDVKTEGTLRARFEKAASCSPCILLLRHVDAFSQTTQSMESGKKGNIIDALQECIAGLQQAWSLTGYPVLVLATTCIPERVDPRILSSFKHEIVLEAPGEQERHDILLSLLHDCHLAPDVSIRDLAIQTAALVAADLVDFVYRAKHVSVQRAIDDTDQGEMDLFKAGIPMIAADFDMALSEARASYSENIGAPKIPLVSWDDVGGLAHVKSDILDTIQLPLEHPELFADGLKKRSGILLYGPPGTGKTLLAKAVATSCALNFFSVKGPELLNMYIGESEANVRRVFQRARDARPCVIFFDELDSVAPKRGNHGDSGGVMDRIVSQILAELDGLSAGQSGADVFVIGATNRPDLLDPALLRPGRFDRMLYLGVSNTHDAQLNILQALTRKFRLHPDLQLSRIAEQCPFHYTGADFYALCADALLKAMSRKAQEVEATIAKLNAIPPDPRHPHPLTPQYYLAVLAAPEELDVLVSQDDFDAALSGLAPSVSQAEMEHYARVQQQFSKETINGPQS